MITRFDDEFFAPRSTESDPNRECMGCRRETELVCTTCLGALCVDCRAGHVCDPISHVSVGPERAQMIVR